MGLFGSKKKLHVASTVYNMAGEFNPNQTYMKATVLSSVLNKKDLGDSILNAMVNGPYIGKKRFFGWCNRNDYKGNVITTINRQKDVDLTVVYSEIEEPVGQIVYVQKAFIERADIVFFAEKHIIETNISLRYTAWTTRLYDASNIEITYEDTSTEIVPLPVDFDINGDYLVIFYDLYKEDYTGDLVEGAIIVSNDLPDTSSYTVIVDEITETVPVTLTTTTHVLHEYSNGDPDTEENSSSDEIVDFDKTYKEKTLVTYLGNTTEQTLEYRKDFYYEWLDYNVQEDVDVDVEVIDHGTYTETITTTVTTEYIENEYSYKEDYQITYSNEFISTNMIIYLLGSGITNFDDFIDETTDIEDEFYPIIPLRINNVSISDIPSVYEPTKKAYKKLITNQSIDKLLEKIEDNPSIDDIDWAYICLGVSLNSTYKRDKKYIYKFLKNLIPYQFYDRDYYNSWLDRQNINDEFLQEFTEWFIAQSNPFDPLYGTPKPINDGINQGVNAGSPVLNKLVLKTDNTFGENYRSEIVWLDINEDTFSGLGKIDAEVNEYWFEFDAGVGTINDWWLIYLAGFTDIDISEAVGLDNIEIYMFHQVSETVYTKLTITGMEHRNYVYEENYVKITARRALQDEDITGFIIPLHIPTLNELSLLDRNEIVLYSHQIIFNSLFIVKTRWYQNSLFRVVIAIAVIVIATYFTGGFSTTTSGFVTTGLTVAGFLGVSTSIYMAFFIGLGVSLLTGVVLNYVLQSAFQLVFDKQLASLLAAMSTVIITSSIILQSGSLAINVSQLTDVSTIIKLTTTSLNSLANNFSNVPELYNTVQQLSNVYGKLQEQIENQNALLNITPYSNDFLQEVLAQNSLREYNETSDQYLERTLASSDTIIQTSLNLVERFTEIMLKIKNDSY